MKKTGSKGGSKGMKSKVVSDELEGQEVGNSRGL
jgi:hypothetical protein